MQPLLVDLDGTGVVRLEGPDARRFCNGMFTNNARDLAALDGQRTAMCDAKGRLLGLLDLYAVGEHAFVAILEGVSAEDFEERYGKYIVFDDVELTDLTPTFAVLTVQGEGAREVLVAAGLPVPDLAWAAGEVSVARHDRAGGGFDLLVPKGRKQALVQALVAAGAELVPFDRLDARRVALGRVRWPVDMPGRALIHELGSLRDEVCHFEKGCYIGQETIHRVDVMGEVRKRLVGLRIATEEPPAGDWEVQVDGKAVGRLTSPVRSDLGVIGLAVVRKPHDAPGTPVQLVSGDRVLQAEVAPLPFPGT